MGLARKQDNIGIYMTIILNKATQTGPQCDLSYGHNYMLDKVHPCAVPSQKSTFEEKVFEHLRALEGIQDLPAILIQDFFYELITLQVRQRCAHGLGHLNSQVSNSTSRLVPLDYVLVEE